MNKEDLLKMIPDAERIKDSLEKNLKKNKLTVTSKNGMVTAVINYQQEITDLVIDNRLLDPTKAGALKASLVEALNQAIKSSRNKMLEETARAIKLI
ncbi:MAG: YbaB/EbfC family nucleoid-associated protein [Syntrophomonadaceae bacterium]|nr:YbaB/EbfC family nucleoid-associated protein [Syntrophomonadaceae bacterium]